MFQHDGPMLSGPKSFQCFGFSNSVSNIVLCEGITACPGLFVYVHQYVFFGVL